MTHSPGNETAGLLVARQGIGRGRPERHLAGVVDGAVSRGRRKSWLYLKCVKDLVRLLADTEIDTDAEPPDNMLGIINTLNRNGKKDDKCAISIVKHGALVIYTDILQIGNGDEQIAAAEGICIFSWTCWGRTRNEPGCIEGESDPLVYHFNKSLVGTNVFRWIFYYK